MNVTREIIEASGKCFKGHQIPPDFNWNDFFSSLDFKIFLSSSFHVDGFQTNVSVSFESLLFFEGKETRYLWGLVH